MFDHPENPDHLIDSLLTFIETWEGGLLSWYGVPHDKLSAVALPTPLRRLYAAVGNMPGRTRRNGLIAPFLDQDTILPLEWLSSHGERVLFAIGDEGYWRCYTETYGDDPPVWFAFGEGEPELEAPSLASFLVTLCLKGMTCGCMIRYAGNQLVEAFTRAGFRVAPLWSHGLFPMGEQLEEQACHLADGRAIILGDRCVGFRFTEDEDHFSPALTNAERIAPAKEQPVPVADFLNDPSNDPFFKKMVYERLALDHQRQADVQQSRADECRRLAREVVNSEPGDATEHSPP